MPVQSRVLGKSGAGGCGQRERRAQLRVGQIGRRVEQAQRVGAALEEHGDEHPAGRAGRGARDPVLERAEADLVEAVHGECEANRAREEREGLP